MSVSCRNSSVFLSKSSTSRRAAQNGTRTSRNETLVPGSPPEISPQKTCPANAARALARPQTSGVFENAVLRVELEHDGTMRPGFRFRHLRIGNDDDEIVDLGEPRRRAIDPDDA